MTKTGGFQPKASLDMADLQRPRFPNKSVLGYSGSAKTAVLNLFHHLHQGLQKAK